MTETQMEAAIEGLAELIAELAELAVPAIGRKAANTVSEKAKQIVVKAYL